MRCDPSLPYDADFTPPTKPDPKKQVPISRPNFVELCEQLVVEDEKAFEALWRRVGISVDWSQDYTTIGPKAQTVSQTAFLRNFARGEAYLQEAPTLWDVTFQTAVAQAELEAREYAGAYHRVAFHKVSAGSTTDEPLFIETTRPELIPSVVALIAHPETSGTPTCSAPPSPRRSSASRSRCWPTRPPSPTRAPASRCAARSVT